MIKQDRVNCKGTRARATHFEMNRWITELQNEGVPADKARMMVNRDLGWNYYAEKTRERCDKCKSIFGKLFNKGKKAECLKIYDEHEIH